MVGEFWTKEEKLRLKEMRIDPVTSSPESLKKMVTYFRTPGSSLWAVTKGAGPFHVSKSLGRKIRDYQAEGALGWLMDETTSSNQWFGPAWRGWLRSKPAEFSQAVDAYLQELGLQIQTAKIHLKLRSTFEPRRPPRVRYGPMHHPFVESIFTRDPELANIRVEFKSAIGKNDISRAMILSKRLGEGLVGRIAI